MNIQARKIEFIQEFLKLQSEDIISRLENFLKMEKEAVYIDLSESDFDNNKFKSNTELMAKYLK